MNYSILFWFYIIIKSIDNFDIVMHWKQNEHYRFSCINSCFNQNYANSIFNKSNFECF